MELTIEQIKELKTRLGEQLLQLEDDLKEAKKGSKPVTLDQTAVGRVSRVDAIQLQQMQLAAVKRIENRIQTTKLALSKIDSEEFGLCQNCEEPIAFNRLLARPESQLCISCAK